MRATESADWELAQARQGSREAPRAIFVSSKAPRTTTQDLGVPSAYLGIYPVYRIPAILKAQDGRLLAFAEGRQARGDSGRIDIVMKLTDDGGKTWSKERTLVSDTSYDKQAKATSNTCGNPCPIFDELTGRIWLLWTWNLGSLVEGAFVPTSKNRDKSRLPYAIYSDDNGETWHGKDGKIFESTSGRAWAIDLTSTCKDPSWSWFATGPGIGISTSSGELLAPANAYSSDTDISSYVGLILRYNRKTGIWQRGRATPAGFGTNESTLAELNDGRILLNSRNQMDEPRCRIVHITSDYGASWDESFYENQLPDPACQGALLRLPPPDPEKTARLAFANLHITRRDYDNRSGLAVRVSYDDGKTWLGAVKPRDPSKPLHTDLLGGAISPRLLEDRTAYSSLVSLGRDEFGMLYEGNTLYPGGQDTGQFGVMLFAQFTVSDVLRTATAAEPTEKLAAETAKK